MAANRPHFRNLFEELEVLRESVTQFSFGAPSLKILEKLRPLLSEATRIRMENEETGDVFQYGALRGDPLFVGELAKFLSIYYKEPVCSDDLVCTGGASSGLFLLTSLVFNQGDYIFVEDPTYFNAIEILKNDLNMNVVVAPMDDEGVDVEAFDRLLIEYGPKLGKIDNERPYRAMFYTIPVFHNPTSRLLPADKCSALIKVLRKHDILAVCDDVYNLIYFGNAPAKRLLSYDRKTDSDYKGHVVSNGSFSKFVAPGMRLGWIEGPEIVVDKLIRRGRAPGNLPNKSAMFKSGGGKNQYTSAIMGTALQTGILSGYITDMVETLKLKMEVMCRALDEHMKPFIEYTKPKGGYFVWVQLLIECDVKAFQRYCIVNHKVDFRPGPCFSVNGNFRNCIRLSFAYVEKDEIEKGIKELALALQNFLKKGG